MRAIYRATYGIPELGIEPGDTVIIEPEHPRAPLKIVRSFAEEELPIILDRVTDFPLLRVDQDGQTTHSPRRRLSKPRLHRWLRLVD